MKIVMLGDGLVGKTHLVKSFLKKEETNECYDPFTQKSSWKEDFHVDSKTGPVTMTDIQGQEEYNDLRAKEYASADTFILVFSVAKDYTFENIKGDWIKQLQQKKVTNIPVLIVGVDIEKRSNQECTTKEKAEQLVNELKKQFAEVKYCECSFENKKEINAVFDIAFEMAANYCLTKSKEKSSVANTESNQGRDLYGFHSPATGSSEQTEPLTQEQEQQKQIKAKQLQNFLRKGIEDLDPSASRNFNKTFTM